MGWEFSAVWVEEPTKAWLWTWRRIADDSGEIIARSAEFRRLEDCIEDARRNGFDQSVSRPVE